MTPRRIYVASSWRNPGQPAIVEALRAAGHEVYDFRNPAPGNKGFAWRDCGGEAATEGPGTGARTIPSYLEAIRSPRAAEGFAFDKQALDWSDTCVLVLPCGRSAHLELGYAAGKGKETHVLLHEDKFEPELMYLLNDGIHSDMLALLSALEKPPQVSEHGYCIRHVDGRWRTVDTLGMPDWTDDPEFALCFRLPEHAHIFATDDPDDVRIVQGEKEWRVDHYLILRADEMRRGINPGAAWPFPDRDERQAFEDAVLGANFIKSIKRTGRGGPLELAPDPEKLVDKEVLLERDGDDYKREEISAMWFGWQLRAEKSGAGGGAS